tara:strand:+ start:100 stop:246 length:147 start_codon:yes stop_codon:yes gene_type:complete
MSGHLGFEMRLGLRSTYTNLAQPKVQESKEIDRGKPKLRDKPDEQNPT